MRRAGPRSIISAMTSRPNSSKVLLVAGPRLDVAGSNAVPIRRYRIARLRLDSRPAGGASRFEHLKRVYD
jgi:hypothetical protein